MVPGAVALRSHPDLAHFPWNGQVPPLPGHLPVVITLHDVLPLTIPGYFQSGREEAAYRASTQRDLQRADAVFTDSAFSKAEILRHFAPRVEPTVLLYGPTLPPPGRNVPLPAVEEYFLYAGGYHPRKGLPGLLRAFLALHREGRLRSTLVLTGSRTSLSPDFDRMVGEGTRSGALRELGYVSDEELALLYANALALVYPSAFEGFGLPPLEAMSLGCPVITTQGTSLPEVCGDAVLYVSPDGGTDLAAALERIETSPELRAELSRRGRERALLFRWSRTAQTYLECVDGLLASRQRRIV
jgi:glycosyltransferase involved in cell wall biosynthesis